MKFLSNFSLTINVFCLLVLFYNLIPPSPKKHRKPTSYFYYDFIGKQHAKNCYFIIKIRVSFYVCPQLKIRKPRKCLNLKLLWMAKNNNWTNRKLFLYSHKVLENCNFIYILFCGYFITRTWERAKNKTNKHWIAKVYKNLC